jgi:predicted O-methyltransferase YrrM
VTGIDRITQEHSDATVWCDALALEADQALLRLVGNVPIVSVRERFSDIFARADVVARDCPVTMGGPGDLDLIYRVAEHLQARRVIETGVAYGWSSLSLLLSLEARDGLLVSTDLPYPGLDNEAFVGCVVPQDLRRRWVLLKAPDRTAVPEAIRLAGTIDMCHYDSDKSYDGRLWTYSRLWRALRPGGILISDDVGDNFGFRDFADSLDAQPVIVRGSNKYVGMLVKP